MLHLLSFFLLVLQAAILYNIKYRHGKALPYTRTGDMIVAVNPYQWITSLYTESQRKHYAQKLVWETSESDPRERLAPHVYETSALSYKGMSFDGLNQSILVSGESGAGKTETVKICMNHIASVQEGPRQVSDSSPVVQRIVESNPVLEAFGNAQTRRNDNSSRFGKYLQLQFNPTGGVRTNAKLVGSKAEVFLLEKNRVVEHDSAERTYHIFYQLVAAPEDAKKKIWEGLCGTTNTSFKYVGATATNKIEGMTDAEHFKSVTDTLKLVGIGEEELTKFYRAICVVLQLGNIAFGPDKGDNDKSTVTSAAELSALAKLMGIPEADLTLCLTERTMATKGEVYKVPLSTDDAKGSADALAKEIYGKVFLWVVKAINTRTCAEMKAEKAGTQAGKLGTIGLLDIFGFEFFEVNRFEQLCINYANEKLQAKFTKDIFKSVMEEYKFEGIPLADIKYDDNTHVLDLIEGRTGLCALLNEECVRPKGSGSGFVNKALSANKNSPALIANKTDRGSFGVIHYAGTVFYDAEFFVESNKDTLPTDLEDCACKCSNSIIADAFNFDKYHAAAVSKKGGPKRQKSNIMAPTLWTKYKAQLSSLMTSLYATHSRYIRCIKPNTVKKPLIMEHTATVEQLRCAGIVAGVTISRSAFPNRLPNSTVYARYNNMWDRNAYPSAKSINMTLPEKMRADCEAVMTCALKEKETADGKVFVVGKTRTYFRAGALEFLESHRVVGLDAQAIAIQKSIRGWLVRKDCNFSPKGRREEEERLRREEEERQERLKREKEEQEAKLKKEMQSYDKEMADLKRKLEMAEESGQRAEADAKEAEARAQSDLDALIASCKEQQSGIDTSKKELDRLNASLEANMKLIEVLRKENKKLKKAFEKQSTLHIDLTANNKKLSKSCDANALAFEASEGDLQYAAEVNERLMTTLDAAKDENAHMKEGVNKGQSQYMAFAESRLELQKTLAYILNTTQDGCTDSKLVEDCFATAHACEAEAKAIMDVLEARTDI